jgi:hypothetical protein
MIRPHSIGLDATSTSKSRKSSPPAYVAESCEPVVEAAYDSSRVRLAAHI